MTEPVTKWIVLIENQGGFGVDVSRALDAGVDLAIHNFDRSFEDAPHDALLAPDFTFFKLSVSKQTGQLGARTRSAGRAVVRLSRAENEILAVGATPLRVAKEFNVIDLFAIVPGDSLAYQGLSDSPSAISQLLDVLHAQLQPMVAHKKKPVASPGNVSNDPAITLDFNSDILC
jgi:hypothetical protein